MACILLVDDDENLLSGLRVTLERRGHQILEARNGREAVALYREKEVDLIITDVLMPEKDGLEVIMELKREFPDVKIIAMSGGYTRGPQSKLTLESAKHLGAMEILEKPFQPDQLDAAINQVLQA